jgi:hypothetical protein
MVILNASWSKVDAHLNQSNSHWDLNTYCSEDNLIIYMKICLCTDHNLRRSFYMKDLLHFHIFIP